MTLGLATKPFVEKCANVRGKEKLRSCEPFGPHFWNDIISVKITHAKRRMTTPSKRHGKIILGEGDLENIHLLKKNQSQSTRKTNKTSMLTYACFFQSTKTAKKIMKALDDLVVLAILALYSWVPLRV